MSRRLRCLALALAASCALFLVLGYIRVHENIALLPNPVHLELALGTAELPRSEPLIVSGAPERGDFLTVRYVDEHTITFVYDSWGSPGLVSAPVPLSRDRRLHLEVEMPALDRTTLDGNTSPGRVRVAVNGQPVLEAEAAFHRRDPDRLFFAVNPIGGSACSSLLRGRIFLERGAELRGTPNIGFSSKIRLSRLERRAAEWLRREPRQVAALYFCCLVLVGLTLRLASTGSLHPGTLARLAFRHRWFVGASAVVTGGYVWLVTLGSLRFDEAEVFGNFYDFQAASFLEGRLDVPNEAIFGEAFEARGKLYGYFGPTPALLRLPFVASGLAFGKLSRSCMLAYFVASLLAAYLILQEGWRRRRNAAAGQDLPSPFATCILILSVGWGSTIFFLGSRGLIFHEAIAGGIAFALWSAWCALRFLRAPASRWWLGALLCGILSIHTRPPTGLFALTLLGCVSVWLALREHQTAFAASGRWRPLWPSLRRHAAIGVLCALGAISLNGLAYLKFGVFDPAPLHMSRPYANNSRLAAIDGKSLHAVNLPFNLYTYVIRPNFRLERDFPWIYLGSPIPGHYFPKAKIDLPDHTLAMPYSMPSLFAVATLGGLIALIVAPGLRAAFALVWLAALPMTLILFAAVATAQRYTGDFCPVLIVATALALPVLPDLPARWRQVYQAVAATITLAAIAVTVALTLHYQGETLWGVPEETRANYRELRISINRLFGVAPP